MGFFIAFCVNVAFTQKKSNIDDKESGEKSKTSQNFSDLQLAQDLANYGRKNKSAESLIAAVKIVITNPSAKLSSTKEEKANEDKTKSSKEEKDNTQTIPALDAGSLLAEARQFANGNQNLLGLIAELEPSAESVSTRSSTYGPYRLYEKVGEYTSDWYTVKFNGGYRAEIVVKGDGDTDLDLFVYDESGNLVRSDTSYGDACYVSWFPSWTGNFKIKIKNTGRVYNSYVLMTN